MAQLTSIPQSSDPRYFSVNGTNITFPLNPPIMRYSTLIDLDNLTYGEVGETLQELIDKGLITEQSYVNNVDFEIADHFEDMGKKGINTREKFYKYIQDFFLSHGYKVSLTGIRHQYECWRDDCKSGYRGRNYHLFTPCRHNPFSVRLSTLSPICKEWQKTYWC